MSKTNNDCVPKPCLPDCRCHRCCPSIQGEKGDKGDKGEKGDKGKPGLDGAQGAQGEKGEKGEKGDKGKPGLDGAQGAQGEKGDKGDKGEKGEPGLDGAQGAQGEKGDKGDKGEKGEPGLDGEACHETAPILQPFVNSNIKNKQTIPPKGAVTFPKIDETPSEWLASGIGYNGADTFEIMYSGLYSITCVLSLDTALTNNTFYIELNRASPVAGAANIGTTGEIVLTRVGYFSAGTTIRIVNGSSHAVTIANATDNISSTGHLAMFRFADNMIEHNDIKTQ
jgi:hypothetical protein